MPIDEGGCGLGGGARRERTDERRWRGIVSNLEQDEEAGTGMEGVGKHRPRIAEEYSSLAVVGLLILQRKYEN